MKIMLDKNDASKVINLLINMETYFEVLPKGEFVNINAHLSEEEEEFIDSFLDTL